MALLITKFKIQTTMETLQKIKDFCQDEINEFSVLGYDPSQYQLGYNSAINDIKEIYEGIPDNPHQIEKLEAENKELVNILEEAKQFLNYVQSLGTPAIRLRLRMEIESLIQKHKQ